MGLPGAAHGNRLLCQQLLSKTSLVSLPHHPLTCSTFSSSPLPWHPYLSSIVHRGSCPSLELSRSFQKSLALDHLQHFWRRGMSKCQGRWQLLLGILDLQHQGRALVCMLWLQPARSPTEGERPALLIALNAHDVSAFVLNTPVLTGLS